ncbi:Arylsulfatase A [Prosthecobacter debontii]|uniref:Arylsulfatase A n=2 Tax=Prosthecobacter debontii TaxID=48467 RepID=A0A1T4WGW3_9BACT|nr:Arylsulfatase A [Prosthecobacter debontii]
MGNTENNQFSGIVEWRERRGKIRSFQRAMKRLFLFLAAVVGLHAEAPKPNIVFILADDLGRADCGFMGGEIATPHLDKLAKAGALLDQFYVQPVCSPTRAALMTGRYPMRQGLQVGVIRPWANYGLDLSERLLPQALKEVGYQTAIVGKWHLGFVTREYLPTQRGFDQQYGHYNGAIDYFKLERDGGHDWHRNDHRSDDKGYSTHLLGEDAARVIRERDKDKPLFLYVPFNAVHSPWQVPEEYVKPYAHLKGNRAIYAGMLTCMDEAVGKISAAVDEAGIRDNTLFIFSSDNGGPSPGVITDNGPIRAGKGTLYEGGTRVVAFATWQGKIQAGSVVKAPLHIVDWYPTLLKLAGASAEQKLPLDGKDAWPAITEGAASPHDTILYNTTPNNGAIRMGDWKLVINGSNFAGEESEDGGAQPKGKGKGKGKGQGKGKAKAKKAPASKGKDTVELFNLADDPYEGNNLADSHPEKVAELKAKLDEMAAQALPPKSNPMPKDYTAPKVWGE